MEPSTFGDRVAQARRELAVRLREDVGPSDLARMLDVTPATVYRWEGNKKTPPAETIERLAAVLGVTPGFLLFGHLPKYPDAPLQKVAEQVPARATRARLERPAMTDEEKRAAKRASAKKRA